MEKQMENRPMFHVELIDSKGNSQGFIGYKFYEAGAQAACAAWNLDRERGDLVAVIRPVIEPVQPLDVEPTIECEACAMPTPSIDAIATSSIQPLSQSQYDAIATEYGRWYADNVVYALTRARWSDACGQVK